MTSEVCGWPVQRPTSTTTWWCGKPFGHDDPHALLDGHGKPVATAAGYGPDDTQEQP